MLSSASGSRETHFTRLGAASGCLRFCDSSPVASLVLRGRVTSVDHPFHGSSALCAFTISSGFSNCSDPCCSALYAERRRFNIRVGYCTFTLGTSRQSVFSARACSHERPNLLSVHLSSLRHRVSNRVMPRIAFFFRLVQRFFSLSVSVLV
jgi:hypothetical protein